MKINFKHLALPFKYKFFINKNIAYFFIFYFFALFCYPILFTSVLKESMGVYALLLSLALSLIGIIVGILIYILSVVPLYLDLDKFMDETTEETYKIVRVNIKYGHIFLPKFNKLN